MAAATGCFKRILQVLEKWPLDETKAGRDLGQFLREKVNKAYKTNQFEADVKFWDKQYLSLQNLVDNKYCTEFPRNSTSSATGLTKEQCNIALSNEFLEELNEESKGFFSKGFCSLEVESTIPHTPVMLNETIEYLKPGGNQIILDMTFGAGGHSRKLLESAPQIKLLALDRDPLAYNYAVNLSKDYPDQVVPLLGKFSDLPQLLSDHNFGKNSLDGILMDCGCSSMQFDIGERGFSISKNGPLDMRMDYNRCENSVTAADVLAKATEGDIYKILKIYGEEKQAKKIARTIVESRYLFKKLQTTEELADLVDSCFDSEYRQDKLQRRSHNATKTFQALRIFVNNELNELNYAMILAHHYLKLGGRLITITFHSLEDTIVKRHLTGNLLNNSANPLPLQYSSHMVTEPHEMMKELMEKNWVMLHKHVLTPTPEEVEMNPRSRSAKLRAAVKIK